MRRLVLILGIAAVGVGAWSLHHVRSTTAACQAQSTYRPGFGASQSCLNQVWFNYLAFGILVAGIFTIGFALLMMRRYRNIKGIAANRRKSLVGTPGEDPTIREHFGEAYSTRSAGTGAAPRWRGGQNPEPPLAPPPGDPA